MCPTVSCTIQIANSGGVIKNEEADVDKFCNNDSCEIIPMTGDNDDQDYAN